MRHFSSPFLNIMSVGTDIYLYDAGIVTNILSDILKHGMHHLAGTAPCGIEIHKHRFAGCDNLIKFFHINICL